MESFCVIFAPMEELELTNDQIKVVALRYLALLTKAAELLPSADPGLLSGTDGTIYLKQKGHRPLSGEDSERIIQSLGTDDDKVTIARFKQAQAALSKRLTKNKWIGLIVEQSGLPYLKMRRRIAKSEIWKAEEMIQIIDVLQRLQV